MSGVIPMSARIELTKYTINANPDDKTYAKITFSEPVTDITSEDIIVQNGTLINFGIGSDVYTWSAEFLPDLGVDLDDREMEFSYTYEELGETYTLGGKSKKYNIRTIIPELIITLSSYELTDTNPVTVTFTFTEEITNFLIDSIIADNGEISNLSQSSSTIWTALYTPLEGITSEINKIVVNTGFLDLDNNPGVQTESLNYTIDTSI